MIFMQVHQLYRDDQMASSICRFVHRGRSQPQVLCKATHLNDHVGTDHSVFLVTSPLISSVSNIDNELPPLLCSQYLEKLPLVLVFGIATAVTAIHRILPQSVSSLLCIEKFQAVPSSVYLAQLIDKVMSNFWFLLCWYLFGTAVRCSTNSFSFEQTWAHPTLHSFRVNA